MLRLPWIAVRTERHLVGQEGSPAPQRKSFPFHYLVILAIPVLAIIPLIQAGIPPTADGSLHMIRAVEFGEGLANGYLFPRWAPDLAHGYGFPVFNYYAPLTYYIINIFHGFGLGFEMATKVTIWVTFILYAGAMYLLAKEFLGRWPAIAAAAAYVYVP